MIEIAGSSGDEEEEDEETDSDDDDACFNPGAKKCIRTA